MIDYESTNDEFLDEINDLLLGYFYQRFGFNLLG